MERNPERDSQETTIQANIRSHLLSTGTWQGEAGKVKTAVSFALQNGYKLIDGAYCYANEEEVGEGLREAFNNGVKREDVFVVTKLWCTYQTSDDRVKLGLEKSLKALGLDYVDLFLVVCFFFFPSPPLPRFNIVFPRLKVG